jgi:glycosyltransferase involved in cell wall biosynthesis
MGRSFMDDLLWRRPRSICYQSSDARDREAPDEQLDGLRDALALTRVSREEGFAFTPLEALALGTPAVVSDLPVFAETLGSGALRVPPGDADALAGALLRLARDCELRTELVETGRAAAGRLSWSRTAAHRSREVLAEVANPS